VQLLKPDLSIAASVFTDERGIYQFYGVLPGKYSIKAMGTDFLPTMRENIRLRSATVVNLTLNSLYEVVQWLPVRSQGNAAAIDDWKWTLRTAENRPLLRWLEDGPLVVVSEGQGKPAHLKARLMASGQTGTFGEDGEFIRAEIEETPSESRELIARVDFAPNTDGDMQSSLGFRQDLGLAGNVESVAAIALHPDISGPGTTSPGIEEAIMDTQEQMLFGDLLEANFGTEQVMARMNGSGQTVYATLPRASILYRRGDSGFAYRVATAQTGSNPSDTLGDMPTLTARNGRLAIQHGLHQELAWERRTNQSQMQLAVYADSIANPNLEGSAHFAPGSPVAGLVLYDPASGLAHVAGANYSSAGLYASVQRMLPHGNSMRISYANGDALVLSQTTAQTPLPQSPLPQTRARHAQMYSLSLSGTVEGTGTKWRATYRWQPDSTLTAIAPYAIESTAPYLNLGVHQRLTKPGQGTTGIEALFDVNNLLAQGYHSWVAPDGSLLVFAQNERSVRAGVAFIF
jgi:protocatechuate 3,4-dioxygenase beta subunit